LEDLGSPQGVYFRIRDPYRLKDGDIIKIGGQKFRFIGQVSEPADFQVSPDRTALLPDRSTSKAVVWLIRLDGTDREIGRYALQSGETSFGRSKGTHTFPDDAYMSTTHARIIFEGGACLVHDIGSTNGTFVRIRKRALGRDGDTVLVGKQLLRILAVS